jgi:hypothetical protein
MEILFNGADAGVANEHNRSFEQMKRQYSVESVE